MKNFYRLALLLSLPAFLSSCFFGVWTFGSSHAAQAARLREEGNYQAAIEEYRLHMAERMRAKNRPADENPAFYELLIGDAYLDDKKPEEALAAYERAIAAGVSGELVNFKLRHFCLWFETQNQLDRAFECLGKYRERDQVLFDYDIDRLHKKMLAEEDRL